MFSYFHLTPVVLFKREITKLRFLYLIHTLIISICIYIYFFNTYIIGVQVPPLVIKPSDLVAMSDFTPSGILPPPHELKMI